MNIPSLTALVLLTFVAASCNPKETIEALSSDEPVTQQMALRFAENMVGLPKRLMVSEARKAAPGEKVTVAGKIMGDTPVFADNIASFTIGDPVQLLANLQETGSWSLEKVPVDVKRDNTITVQFVDEQGKPIHHTAKGVNGLKEQDSVIISGTLDPSSPPDRPVINIEQIIVEK